MSHIDETVRRIGEWLRGKKEEPTKVDIFFTERCNLKCRFCNYSKISSKAIEQEMNDKKILQIIDEVCEMDVKVFGVLGGEPFLRKKVLLKSMEKIKKAGINGSIVTNGTLLEKKDIERMVRIEWDLVRFSVDGLEKTHDYLRGVRGCFKKVLSSIKSFNEIKRKFNSNFPTIEINFVLTNKNYKDLSELMKKISKYNVNFVYVLPMIELTEESKKLKIGEKEILEVNEFLIKAKEIGEKNGVKSNIDEVVQKELFLYSNRMEKIISEEKRKLPCFLPWYTMNINSGGSVTPCAQWPKSEGIKLNEASLKEIWFEGFETMRKRIKSNLPIWCSRCCVPLVDENREINKKLVEVHGRKGGKT